MHLGVATLATYLDHAVLKGGKVRVFLLGRGVEVQMLLNGLDVLQGMRLPRKTSVNILSR